MDLDAATQHRLTRAVQGIASTAAASWTERDQDVAVDVLTKAQAEIFQLVLELPPRRTRSRFSAWSWLCSRVCARLSMVAQGEPPGVTHREPVRRRDRTSRVQVNSSPAVVSWPRERGGL